MDYILSIAARAGTLLEHSLNPVGVMQMGSFPPKAAADYVIRCITMDSLSFSSLWGERKEKKGKSNSTGNTQPSKNQLKVVISHSPTEIVLHEGRFTIILNWYKEWIQWLLGQKIFATTSRDCIK